MFALLCFVLVVLVSPFKSQSRLEAENAALRHQLIVLRRNMQGRVRLTNSDRWFFIQLYQWFPSILNVLTIIRPETLVRLASGRLSLLLALEIAPTGRATTDRDGPTRADPEDEHREPALGSAAHPRRSPQWVGEAHLADQPPDLKRDLWSSPAPSRCPAPVGSKSRLMPPNDGLWPDDRQRRPNIRKQLVETDQYQPVEGLEAGSLRRCPPQHDNLLPQHQVLGFKCRS